MRFRRAAGGGWQVAGGYGAIVGLMAGLGLLFFASPSAAQEYTVTFHGVIGREGVGFGEFLNPAGISLDPAGNLYVADSGNHRIQRLTQAGEYTTIFGGFGFDRQQLNQPMAVVATGLDVYVADMQNRRIKRLDRLLNFLGVLPEDPEASLFGFPRGVAISKVGEIYVADTENEEIVKLNTSGQLEVRFGGFSYEQGRLHRPANIAVGPAGKVYVADTGNHRIAIFDAFGGYLTDISSDTLKAPEGVDVDDSGLVYVADTGNHRFTVFSKEGTLLLSFGAQGVGIGSFSEPRDISVGPAGKIYVADTGNHRIQIFRMEKK
jgi:DNA-binding beta-propeller fold protein YncE